MATTSFGLRYPSLNDPPNVPQDLKFLAEDVNGQVYRAYPCLSTARPTGTPDGFLIRETDTGNLGVWNGTTSAWQIFSPTGAGGGGGGGGTTTTAVWAGWDAGSTAQPIATGVDVTVAFGTALSGSDSVVTRSTNGAGHQFTLTQTMNWTITSTIRFAQNGTGGRLATLMAGTNTLAKVGDGATATTPWTAVLAKGRRLSAGTVIRVVARHNAGVSLALDPEGGPSVSIDFVGV